jgi:hypothetical protein
LPESSCGCTFAAHAFPLPLCAPGERRLTARETSVIFSSIAPSPALRELARDYLIAHFRFDPHNPVPHKRYAPKPEQGITFFVRGRPSIVDPFTGQGRVAPSVAIFGQQMKRCNVYLPPEFLMFRVHFQPGALFRMLGVPLYEFGEDYFDAELILGRDARAG